jgi:hypothetical protein
LSDDAWMGVISPQPSIAWQRESISPRTNLTISEIWMNWGFKTSFRWSHVDFVAIKNFLIIKRTFWPSQPFVNTEDHECSHKTFPSHVTDDADHQISVETIGTKYC